MRLKNYIKNTVAAVLAAGMSLCAVVSPLMSLDAQAAAIIQPGVVIGGGKNGSINTSSADYADYLSTGGLGLGGLTLSAVIPPGCIEFTAMDVVDGIVEAKDLYSYDDMAADLKQLAVMYPSYMRYTSLGRTADGREIYEAQVGKSEADTHILITASTHAREYITTLLVMMQMEYILQYADSGALDGRSLKSWLDDVCLHFVPMVNPDGVSISQFGIDGLGSEDLKENVRTAYENDVANGWTALPFEDYLKRWKANANGVNLNDNFNALTENIENRTDKPSFQNYYGTPGSENETKAIQKLIDSTHFKANINYHSTGSVIYWDYDENQLREHCRDFAHNIKAVTGYQMLYNGTEGGSVKVYCGTRRLPVTSLTVEVGRGQAPVSIDEYNAIWAENKFVLLYTMKWAKEKGK